MEFNLTQKFESTAEQVIEAYASAELYEQLTGLPKLGGLEVVARQQDGHRVRLEVRYHFKAPLPSAVTAVVDPEKLSWIQETKFDTRSGRANFVLKPDHYPDRLKASGSFEITEVDGKAQRKIKGEVKVRALLVSGKVESVIIDGLKEYLKAEAPATDAFIT